MPVAKGLVGGFVRSAGRDSALTAEESAELARRWQRSADLRARDALILGHLRIASVYAFRYGRYGVPAADLFAEGTLGLLRATDKFDPDRGVRFATYAEYWVRSRVLGCMSRSWSLVRGGPRELSLDAPRRLDGCCLLDALSDGAPSVEEGAESLERSRVVREALAEIWQGLDERQRALVRDRLMQGRGQGATLADIGVRFGVTRQRVQQIEGELVAVLRRTLATRLDPR